MAPRVPAPVRPVKVEAAMPRAGDRGRSKAATQRARELWLCCSRALQVLSSG